jgi:formate dehydrogenase major subunit
VRVVSQYGSAVLPVHVTDAVAPGQLFATFHTPAVRMNAVTGPHRDSAVGTPEYQLTAVRVERVTGPSDAADAGA